MQCVRSGLLPLSLIGGQFVGGNGTFATKRTDLKFDYHFELSGEMMLLYLGRSSPSNHPAETLPCQENLFPRQV